MPHSRVGRQLGNQLQAGDCRVFSSDLRVRVPKTGLATYPDVTVVCGRTERDPASETTVVNPTLLVEVTSDSSEDYDRGSKLSHYQTIAPLAAVIVVSHREPRVEVLARDGEGWSHAEARAGGRALVPALGVEIDVDALYAASVEPGA